MAISNKILFLISQQESNLTVPHLRRFKICFDVIGLMLPDLLLRVMSSVSYSLNIVLMSIAQRHLSKPFLVRFYSECADTQLFFKQVLNKTRGLNP